MPRIPVVIQQGGYGTSNPATRTGPAPSTSGGPAMGREHFASRQPNAIQANARAATRQSTSADDAGANVLRGVKFVASVAQTLPHALGQAWVSYRIENVRGGFARFQATPNTQTDGKTITVTADANCTADVRVW